ncbi:MAG: IS3 family transposase, partial [Frankiales bacterium]|nr:IS3 family transposase [Frankiales bacterium]
SRSAFYAWIDRPASARAVRAQELGERVVALHGASDGTYGVPRVLSDLRAEGVVVSAKTVAKAMHDRGIRGCAPRQWRTTTIPEPDLANIPTDLVRRQFDQGRLDAVWVGPDPCGWTPTGVTSTPSTTPAPTTPGSPAKPTDSAPTTPARPASPSPTTTPTNPSDPTAGA